MELLHHKSSNTGTKLIIHRFSCKLFKLACKTVVLFQLLFFLSGKNNEFLMKKLKVSGEKWFIANLLVKFFSDNANSRKAIKSRSFIGVNRVWIIYYNFFIQRPTVLYCISCLLKEKIQTFFFSIYKTTLKQRKKNLTKNMLCIKITHVI